MTENSIESAVAVPEPIEPSGSPNSLKRRPSVTYDNGSKRRRLSTDETSPERARKASITSTNNTTEEKSRRRESGKEEERKRGRRLFGGLLGTLAQSSSTATERRRADIERKQQTKLKQQDEEYNELTRKKYDDLMAERRRGQKIYDKQSMHIRHSNMLAMAHFLKTTTKPVLYYKPWLLREKDEAKIEEQIQEAKATIARETSEFDARRSQEPEKAQPTKENNPALPPETKDKAEGNKDTVGADAATNDNNNREPATREAQPGAAAVTANDEPSKNEIAPSESKAHEDDSGDVLLEDKEDTVIY